MEKRYSFYREIHKAIRSLLGEIMVSAGRVDFTRAEGIKSFRRELIRAFTLLTSHAEHEERFIAPLIHAHVPIEIASAIDATHQDQEAELDRLLVLLDSVDPAADDADVRGHEFVVQLSRLVADLLVHMADEEEVVLPALWKVVEDSILIQVEGDLVASLTPDEMTLSLTWMLPALNETERLEMFAGMRAGAPAAVFDFVRSLADQVLSSEDLEILETGLRDRAA